jgi:hypothetical protein
MTMRFPSPLFGINIHMRMRPDADLVAEALHAEQLGFDLVTLQGDVLHGTTLSFETWTLLTLERIRKVAEAAGRKADEISYAYNVPVLVEAGSRSSQGRIAGSVAEVARHLADFVRHGFTLLNLWPGVWRNYSASGWPGTCCRPSAICWRRSRFCQCRWILPTSEVYKCSADRRCGHTAVRRSPASIT